MNSAKPYGIAKRTVWEAYQQVKANRGAAGIDDETIADFEQDLSKNLYKLWNRMSSGSYFPPPVKQVEIPKASGGTRKLGVPTVSDRVAQTVVKLLIEPELDSIFHPDSYGYRPGRSAKQAVAITRERCWRYDWVVEFDIKAAFDQIDHGLLMKAVRTHIKEDWILLYIERCLHTTAANESDVAHAHEVLHGQEAVAFLDAGYTGVAKREEVVQAQVDGKIRNDIEWNVAKRRGTITKMAEGTLKTLTQALERVKAQIRARVEHPFHVVKNLFHHKKTRYKGLAKNEAQLYSLFGLANLVLAKTRLMKLQNAGMSAP